MRWLLFEHGSNMKGYCLKRGKLNGQPFYLSFPAFSFTNCSPCFFQTFTIPLDFRDWEICHIFLDIVAKFQPLAEENTGSGSKTMLWVKQLSHMS